MSNCNATKCRGDDGSMGCLTLIVVIVLCAMLSQSIARIESKIDQLKSRGWTNENQNQQRR